MRWLGAPAGLCAALLCAGGAAGQSAPDEGRAFEPPALRPAQFAIKSPHQDPAAQVHDLITPDGTAIRIETWLPTPKDGATPPARVPVVADISPYHLADNAERPGASTPAHIDLLVPRGYAYAAVHVRGTGASTGCYEVLTGTEADDAARAVQYLGEQAPFGDGNVGLIGKSNEGGQQLNVAGRGERALLRTLKAIVPVSPVVSHSDFRLFDGVPILFSDVLTLEADLLGSAGLLRDEPSPSTPERAACQDEYVVNALDPRGVPTAWDVERELRRFAPDISVPTLFTMGLHETQTRQLIGLFDRIDAFKVGVFGLWRHDYPDANFYTPAWSREDWSAMLVAWYDRWLRGVDTGVERWPTVQVQDSTGQWRAEADFPTTGGPVGQLALGADGALGVVEPTGEDRIDPLAAAPRTALADAAPGGQVVYETAPAAAPLRLTGEPVLDLWVVPEDDGGKLLAELRVLGPDGTPVPHTRRVGARSFSHLDPLMPEHYFRQTEARPPAADQPLRVPLRLEPADLVVPQGGRLRVVLSTAGGAEEREASLGSLAPGMPDTPAPPDTTAVRILHDCEHVSALRFLMPVERPDLLDVREADQQAPLGAERAGAVDHGIAGDRVCGRPPERLDLFGPEKGSSGGPARPVRDRRAARARRRAAATRRRAARRHRRQHQRARRP